jgi:hypothetical protein
MYDQLFQIANAVVLPAWLLLIIAPHWKWTSRIVVSVVVTLLALLYVYLITGSISSFGDFESFGSLEGIMQLFGDPGAVLAGWVHYLAFDLMTGWFITFDARRKGVNRYLIIPCLLFTFISGPFGLLLYLLLRWISTGSYFVEWEQV